MKTRKGLAVEAAMVTGIGAVVEYGRNEVQNMSFNAIPTTKEEPQDAWSEEVQQRTDELRTGQVKAVPWEEARKMFLSNVE